MKIKDIKHWHTERISTYVLYGIVALTVLLFALFFLIGYDTPYEENPDMKAPLLTNVLMWFMYAMTAITVGFAIWSIVRGARTTDKTSATVNGVPAARIAGITASVTATLLVVTFVTGSSAAMMINGHKYQEAFWLKLSAMFVNTSLLMVVIAFGVMIFGMTRYYRKEE